MKKLSLLLALLMVATCCMLASCGDEETTSSEASTASSATSSVETSSEAESSVEEVSSEAESSVEESSVEESSEEETFEKNPDAIATEGANVAEGKTYTRSLLFRQGDASNDWGWTETKDISYPDDGNDMTDGVIPADDAAFEDAAWMGFHANCPDYQEVGYSWVTIDLEASYVISELTTWVGTQKLGGGISAPSSIEYYVSEDGENFTFVGSVSPVDDASIVNASATVECDVTGRYVQVRIMGGGWNFVSEIEVK